MRGCANIFRNNISPWIFRFLPWLPPAGVLEPGHPPARSVLLRLDPLRGLPASLALLVCCALFAACSPLLSVYNPANSENMHGRGVLVLEPSYIPPVSQELHTRIMNEMESRLQEFPHVGRVVTRKEFDASVKKNWRLRRSYRLLSDTLSVVGFPDQETASKLGRTLNVEMIAVAQLFYIPCEYCEDPNQMALLFYLVEAATGKILWRADFSESVSEDDPQLRSAEADHLVEALFDAMDEDLRPKWQRLRFNQLARRG